MLEQFLAELVFVTLVATAVAVGHQAWLNYKGLEDSPTTKGISPFKYQCRLLAALCWFLYGLSLDNQTWPFVFGMPLFGTACAVILVQVLRYPPPRSQRVTGFTIAVLVLAYLVGIGSVAGIITVASLPEVTRWLPLGAALVLYVPGQAKQIVLNRSRHSVEGLSLVETGWGFLDESIWLFYGLVRREWAVWLPCSITAALFALTLLQFWYYRSIAGTRRT